MSGRTERKNSDSLKFPLTILKYICIFSFQRNSNVFLFTRMLYVLSLSFIVLVALIQFLTFKGDVFKFVGILEGLSAFGQYLGKILVIAYKIKNLTHLIEDVSKFWKTNKCDKIVKPQLENMFKNNLKLQKAFAICVGFSIIMAIISSFFGRDLPFGAWNLNKFNLLYKMTLLAQIITLPPTGMFIIAFDCIFLTFCIEIIVQFRILHEYLRRTGTQNFDALNDKEQHDLIKSYIQHHVFLLKFLKNLQDFYSPAFVVEYVSITPVICAEMYALFESTDLGLMFRYGIICFTSILQLAFYCISADYATSEALTVADAIFDSNWYWNGVLSKSSKFIIQRSQKEFYFTAGGLFINNSRTLLSVLKISWSLCTVMRVIKQKS